MKTDWLVKDKNFYKLLIALAIPISLQNLITFAVNFADNVMVGTLGEVDISAVYMGRQIATVLQCIMNGIGTTMLVLIAQYWGKRNMDSIRRIIWIGFRVALGIGIVYSLVACVFPEEILSVLTSKQEVVQAGIPYLRITGVSFFFFCLSQSFVYSLRGVENTKFGLMLSLVTLVVNVSFNYVLIFGKLGFPQLGITGAAIATLISRVVECVFVAVYIFKLESVLKLKLSGLFTRGKELFYDLVKCGIPIILGEFVWSVNMLWQSGVIGRYDEEVMAAFSITITLSDLVYVWAVGLASAVGIITGKTVGSGQYELMKKYAKTTQVLFAIIGVLSGLLIIGIKGAFVSLYNVTDATKACADILMSVLAVIMAGTCYEMVGFAGLVKAGGDVSFVMKNDAIHVFLIIIPSSYICYKLGAPVWVVFACLKCDQILKCFVALVKINRFNWMKKLTRE